MDMEGFDRIHFGDGDEYYYHAQTYELFIERLVSQFPKERAAIETYCRQVQKICNRFPLYNLDITEPDYYEDEMLLWNAQSARYQAYWDWFTGRAMAQEGKDAEGNIIQRWPFSCVAPVR